MIIRDYSAVARLANSSQLIPLRTRWNEEVDDAEQYRSIEQ